jgi:hypothetical protein
MICARSLVVIFVDGGDEFGWLEQVDVLDGLLLFGPTPEDHQLVIGEDGGGVVVARPWDCAIDDGLEPAWRGGYQSLVEVLKMKTSLRYLPSSLCPP